MRPQRSAHGILEGFELEVGAAAFCRLALWRVRVHWRSPAFYQEWSTDRRALRAAGDGEYGLVCRGTMVRCRNRQTHPPAVSFRAHVRRILRTVRADIGACAGLSAARAVLATSCLVLAESADGHNGRCVGSPAGRPFRATRSSRAIFSPRCCFASRSRRPEPSELRHLTFDQGQFNSWL